MSLTKKLPFGLTYGNMMNLGLKCGVLPQALDPGLKVWHNCHTFFLKGLTKMTQEQYNRFVTATIDRFDKWKHYVKWANNPDNKKEAAEFYASFGKPRVKGWFPTA
jgi:predicted phosphoadenosine phosphosulfate sulfurtransferase